MNNKLELKVPLKKIEGTSHFLVISACFAFNVLAITLIQSIFPLPMWLNTLLFCIKCFLIVFWILIFFGFLYSFNLDKHDITAAILDEKGIDVMRYGFIPWNQIQEMSIYKMPGAPIETIGIRVKDMSGLSKQATFYGKMSVFYSRLFGYPPIIISNIALDNDQVLSFAQRFLPKS